MVCGGVGSENALTSSEDGNVFLLTVNAASPTAKNPSPFGNDGLYQINLASGAITPWSSFASGDVISAAALPGGSVVFVLSYNSGIVAVNSASGHSRATVVAGASIPFVPSGLSLDASGDLYVFGVASDLSGIIAVFKPSFASGEVSYGLTKIVSGSSGIAAFAALPDGSGIYYADERGSIHHVVTATLDDTVVLESNTLGISPTAMACDPAGNVYFGGTSTGLSTSSQIVSAIYRLDPSASALYALTPNGVNGLMSALTLNGMTTGGTAIPVPPPHPGFFAGEYGLDDGVYFLDFPNGNYFGLYSYLTDPKYIYHFDLGYEYVFDAADGKSGVYLYDFTSKHFFYSSPSFPFPYLYDFTLGSTLYYYPDPNNEDHYNTNGVRYFYQFSSGKIITL